jgi:hypothetical protein
VWTHRARQQARIVKHIREHHGSITYDWERRSPVPQWLLDRLGEDFFHSVAGALVRGDVDMKAVSRLSSIQHLTIWKYNLTDETLAPIARLRDLRTLTIQSDKHVPATTRIGDASLALVARLPRLEKIYLDGQDFTAKGLGALSQSRSLRTVWINYCHTSVTQADVQPLVQSGRFQRLMIRKWAPGIGEVEVLDW